MSQRDGGGIDRGDAKRCKLILSCIDSRAATGIEKNVSTGFKAGGDDRRDQGGIEHNDVIRLIDLVWIADWLIVVTKKCLQRSTGSFSCIDTKCLNGMAFKMVRRGKDLGECYATLPASSMNSDLNHNIGYLTVRDPRPASWKSHADTDAALTRETGKY